MKVSKIAQAEQEYANGVGARVEAIKQLVRAYHYDTVVDAKACLGDLALQIQQLRLLKREIQMEMRRIRAAFATERAKDKAGRLGSMFKMGMRYRAAERDRLRQDQSQVMNPLEVVLGEIEHTILNLGHKKVSITHWIEKRVKPDDARLSIPERTSMLLQS